MKPNFALTLSFEGIRLLHRSPAGWTVVGEVPLDEPNLAGALAAMRATAVGLEPGGIRTKVMLPAEQVKVLDAAEPGEAAARAALEGATPYAVADLVFDHVTVAGRTRVAAVARDILDEAEAFVAGHRFHPVSFAAVLPEGGFPGEAFLGETRLAGGGAERVERDDRPTVPRAQRTAQEELGPATALPEPEAADMARGTPVARPDDAGGAAPPAGSTTPGLAGPSEAPLSATGVPEPVFASRSRHTPDLRGPAPVDASLAPRPPSAGDSATPPPLDEARAEPPVRRADPAPQPGRPLRTPAPPPAPLPSPSAAMPAAAFPVTAMGATAPEAVVVAPAPPGRSAFRAAEPGRVPDRAGERPRGKPRFLGLALTAVLLLAMLAVGVLASSTQNGIAGLFGLVDGSVIAAAPPSRSSAPGPAAEPAPSTAAVATPASASAVAEAAPSAPDPDEATRAAAAVAAAIAALPKPEPVPAIAPGAPGAPVTPDEADRVYAATGIWLRAPSLPDLPEPEAVAPTLATAADASRTPGPAPAPLPQVAADSVPATPEAAPNVASVPTAPEVPAASPSVVRLADTPALLPPTRPGAPAANGGPPTAPATPVTASAATATLANPMAEAPGRRPAERPTNPDLPDSMRVAAAPVSAPLGQPGAVPGGVAADALAQLSAPPGALAFASPPAEDGQAPAGAVGLGAFDGSRPPPRPDGLAPEAPAALAAFDGPRPGLRPDGLAPEQPSEDPAVAEGATDPAAIASAVAAAQVAAAPPPAEAALPQIDVQSALASIVAGGPDPLAGATRQAVAVARVPDSRPRNFDGVVRDQLSRTARAAEPAPAPQAASPEEAESSGTEVAAAAAVPSGATAQSVAQAATFADVMALREVNLIGVFGQPSDRRALVRMGNGRYMRVGVGDSLDGGQVTAIGDNALNYTKRGRQVQIVIPGG